MALLGCRLLGIDDPRGLESARDRKRLVTYIEIDRCATDAIGVVTGCRLGKRALKFRDWGKMAATFVDLGTRADDPAPVAGGRAVRVAAVESSKQRARELYPEIADKNRQQMTAYREMPDAELFRVEWVAVTVEAREMPGYKSGRILCAGCGEGISYDREIVPASGMFAGKTMCLGCAYPEERYFQPLAIVELS